MVSWGTRPLSRSIYVRWAAKREGGVCYSESISGRMIDSLGGKGVSLGFGGPDRFAWD
jgi:hypothetical protein